ncbi:MAG: TVP38/TMEM64 family protein [Pseudomonadota bacterium]
MSEHSLTEPAAEDAKSGNIFVKLWPIYIILGGLGLAYSQGWHTYLTPQALADNAILLDQLVRNNLLIVFFAYMLIYAAATAFMVPGGVLTIAGGFLFGLAIGTPATVIGATLGASILFFASKSSIGSVLKGVAGPFLGKMEKGFNENALSYMFALRMIPLFPFAVVNIAPSLLGAKYRDYLITTALGIIPGTLAYTWIGSAIKGTVLDAAASGEALDLGALISSLASNFIPAFIALGVVALLPVAYQKFFGKKADQLESAAQ